MSDDVIVDVPSAEVNAEDLLIETEKVEADMEIEKKEALDTKPKRRQKRKQKKEQDPEPKQEEKPKADDPRKKVMQTARKYEKVVSEKGAAGRKYLSRARTRR